MEKYSSAVSEMYSQVKKVKAHRLEKYIGRLAVCYGKKAEVVGYCTETGSPARLIVDFSGGGGWSHLEPNDVIFKECESYLYVSINDLID